jgi:SpoVK/Ycf46/Vps4 family AAA+-type ATPase
LYGPPGNGKTSLIREVIRAQISAPVSNDAVIIFMDRIPPRRFIRTIQATLSNRLKVVIFEELAAALKNSELDHALAFLDGETSLDRCLILATTNYPERLPGNIVDRPSRFDKLYRISDPDEQCRELLLENYLGRKIEPSEIQTTKGLSTAGIREACLLVRLKNIPFTDASLLLQRHRDFVKKEFGAIKEIGFSARRYFEDVDDYF